MEIIWTNASWVDAIANGIWVGFCGLVLLGIIVMMIMYMRGDVD